jgi:hypothetical protein
MTTFAFDQHTPLAELKRMRKAAFDQLSDLEKIGPGELARFMGTSVDQIDRTYGHLLPDALDRTRTALDAFVRSAHDRPATSSSLESP